MKIMSIRFSTSMSRLQCCPCNSWRPQCSAAAGFGPPDSTPVPKSAVLVPPNLKAFQGPQLPSDKFPVRPPQWLTYSQTKSVPSNSFNCSVERAFFNSGYEKLSRNATHSRQFLRTKQRRLLPFASIESPPESKPLPEVENPANKSAEQFGSSNEKAGGREVVTEETVGEAEEELLELQALADVEAQPGAFPRKQEYPCTADELYYVSSGDWRLAFWRYKPPANAPRRNHPVLLLSGVATNALSYDIDPNVSLARHLRDLGFDTWTLEVRGMGLSHLAVEEDKTADEKMDEVKSAQGRPSEKVGKGAVENGSMKTKEPEQSGSGEGVSEEALPKSDASLQVKATGGGLGGSPGLKVDVVEEKDKGQSNLVNTVNQLRDQLSGIVEEGQRAAIGERMAEIREIWGGFVEEAKKRSALSDRLDDVAERVKGLVEEGQKTGVGTRVAEIQGSLARLAEEGQKVGESMRVKELTGRLSKVLEEGQLATLGDRISGVRDGLGRLLGEGQRAALSGRISDLVNRLGELVNDTQRTSVTARIADLKTRLEDLLEESQRGLSPRTEEIRTRMGTVLSETQKTLDVIRKYDWDFDTLLNEDVPAAISFLVEKTQPPDGKILAVGHSMGGILLYSRIAALSTECQLAAVVAVASSMDYSPSASSLKLLLPLATPARFTSVPVIPLGILARTAAPLMLRPPYTLAWVAYNISARNMMDPPLLRKLLLNNFDTIPVKLLLQMASLFYRGGLKNRSGSVEYRRGLRDCQVPVLALAGAQDYVCPPPAVTETVKFFPEGIVTYKLFGDEDGHHYSHYDLLAGKHAKEEVYPTISDFLIKHDEIREEPQGKC